MKLLTNLIKDRFFGALILFAFVIKLSLAISGGAFANIADNLIYSAYAEEPAPAVTVDLVANGLDGSITINQGDTFTYSWSSQNAVGCNFTSPSNSSADASGSGGPIAPGSDQYPTAGHPVTFTIVCTNASSSATDSVTVNLAQAPAQVTVDLVVNGLDGPVTINNGQSFTYSWSSQNATGCSFTSPSNGSVDVSGSGLVNPGDDQYPAVNGSKTFTITCSNGSSSATDSVVVNVVGTTTGGGGNGTTTTPTTGTTECTHVWPTGTVNFAMATLVVPQGACPVMVSFSSYTFEKTIVPYDKQVLVDNITNTYGPGTYTIGPLKLECNWQTDLYVGPVQTHLLAVGGHDQTNGPVLGYNYMENQVCDQGNIVVNKIVINDDGGTKQAADFPLFVGTTSVTRGAQNSFAFGTYTITETYNSDEYSQSFSGDCDADGKITLNSSSTKVCTITNNDIGNDDNGGGGGGSSSRHRSRSRTTVHADNPQPQVLGVEYEIIPGLPNTGVGFPYASDSFFPILAILGTLVGFFSFNILLAKFSK